MRYIRSQYLRTVADPEGGLSLLYHSLFGEPMLATAETQALLALFEQPQELEYATHFCDGDPTELLQAAVNCHFLVPEDLDERALLASVKHQHLAQLRSGQVVDRMGLAISDLCNFGCEHCLHYQRCDGASVIEHPALMTWEVARQCVDSYLKMLMARGSTTGSIHFGNAEPLINWSVIERVLAYCREAYSTLEIRFAINTNLYLLTEEIARTLQVYQVKINTSLDGLADGNDAVRCTAGGQPTFDRIVANMDLLAEIGYPLDGFSITVTDRNWELVDERIIDFAADRGMAALAFDYDLIATSDVPVQERVNKLMRFKRYAASRGISFFGTWDTVWQNLIDRSLNGGLRGFCAAVEGRSLEFGVDGKIGICSHATTTVGAVQRFDRLLKDDGGLPQLVDSRFPGSDALCRGCPIEGPCAGLCHVTREVAARCAEPAQRDHLISAHCQYFQLVTEALIVEHIQTERR